MTVYNLVSLLFCGIIMLAEGQVYDVVVCSEWTVPQTISCGGQGIIEIESVTIAVLHNRSQCSLDLISVVEQLDNRCKRTDVIPSDGKDVFRRCFGEESCTFDDSVVERVFLSSYCDPEYIPDPYSNVLWFKFSCHMVNPHTPSVALLPLPENREAQGLEVDIFSPYYPCVTPVTDITKENLLLVDCAITPHRRTPRSLVTFTVFPKHVEIRENRRHCQDFLYFDRGPQGGRLFRSYCGETKENKEVWNDAAPITDTSAFNLHIKYMVQPDAARGAKFWLRVTAVENHIPVNVSVTCSKQENIPPLPPGKTCIPLISETSTTSANMSSDIPPTEAATTAPSTINSNTETIITEEYKSGSNTSTLGLLPGILGGVFGLLFVGAIVVTVLCCVIRKRKGQTEEAGKSAVTETRRSRPKSIQEIVAKLKKKKRAPNHPDEEMANNNNSKTKPEKPPKASKPTKPPKPPKPDTTLQTYVRPSSIAKMAALLKKGNNTKRKATNNKNKDDPEADDKVVGKSMEIYDRYEKTRKTSNVNEAGEESRYEHLYAAPLRKESKFSESDRSKSKTTEVNATNPHENDDPEAGNEAGQEFQNEQLYAVPIKKDRKIAESDGSRSNKAEVNATDTDETLMCENDDLYSSFQVEENNAVSEKDDGAQVGKNKTEETDIVAENAVSKETLESAISGYENVKPDTTDIDKNNNDEINNETCTITVPDDFSNNPGSRISLA